MSDSKLFSDQGPISLSSGKTGERIKTPESGKDTYQTMITPPSQPSASTGTQPASYSQDAYAEVKVETPPAKSYPTPSMTYTPIMSQTSRDKSNLERNISTSWSPSRISPVVDERSFVHPKALVIGNVIISAGVFVAPFSAVRGDEEEPIYIGENSAVLEGAVINALPTQKGSEKLSQRLIKVGNAEHPVYISPMVTIAQGVMIHGPVYVARNTFIGMGALVFWAKIGSNCVIEPGALVINVEIPDDRFVPAGLSVTSQKIVSSLPLITDRYRFAKINQEMLAENGEIVNGYLRGG